MKKQQSQKNGKPLALLNFKFYMVKSYLQNLERATRPRSSR